MPSKTNKYKGVIMVLWLCVLLLVSSSFAQVKPKVQNLTRGKLWFAIHESGSIAQLSDYQANFVYPGYYDAGGSQPRVGFICTKSGVNQFAWYHQRFQTDVEWEVIREHELVKNYNFVNGTGMPEEMLVSTVQTKPDFPALGSDLARIELTNKHMAWSLPKYDDFVISQMTIKNTDDEELVDFYWIWDGPGLAPSGGPVNPSLDTEFKWFSNWGCDGAFVYYDDRAHLADGSIVQYPFSPGDQYGDVGNPGNINTAGSFDNQLYAFDAGSFVVYDCTPNKTGSKSVVQNILGSGYQGIPEVDDAGTMSYFIDFPEYPKMLSILTNPQPRGDWADIGKLYERNPLPVIAAGPYDLAPGDSINVTFVRVFGEMDRQLAAAGGIEAVQAYKQQVLQAVEENYQSAVYLLENNLEPQAYPPPTVGTPPRLNLGDELSVVPFAGELVDGFNQGFKLTFSAVPEDYLDPKTNVNDLKEYRIYRGLYNISGPWSLLKTVSKSEAASLKQGDKIAVKVGTKPNIPYRFAVSTVDTDGNESGLTAYTWYSETAKDAPSNELEKVVVVPNPFRQTSGFVDPNEEKRLSFLNIPGQCTIRIYTLSGDLLRTIEHDDGFGLETWGSVSNRDYMLTEFAQNVAPGVYLYHIDSKVSGHEGETAVGKFTIIR